ncbi:hypothetical protein SK571_03970 [Lentzea sp. BCCO 10_0798]|uniref:Uncharacterized protein n=1 Tax=Lentzea kristufekii TaxID=3095430 RepID=A0ABU4TJV2_9PSEU|nr:hypothetical protein [Lentzea sp. BCCO 10_0798]MDX8048527.1 hypothetical protein [Lentzea sp. BCCO 10_0798]
MTFSASTALKHADHCFDLIWGSISAQTARFAILEFLRQAFASR